MRAIELSQLKERVLDLFETDIDGLGNSLHNAVLENREDIYDSFSELVGNDLSVDYLQQIFQYYHADRKDKKQDYTPQTLAYFTGILAGDADLIVDMCAGSGALTIQRWNRNKDQKFRLYEIDQNVIPFLLFNLAIRNIEADVIQGDVLQDEIYNQWSVRKGDKYGRVTCIKSSV